LNDHSSQVAVQDTLDQFDEWFRSLGFSNLRDYGKALIKDPTSRFSIKRQTQRAEKIGAGMADMHDVKVKFKEREE
jgi:hypothetical protein